MENEYNLSISGRQGSCDATRIIPQYDEREFIRKAWISLARDDAPIEIFESGNFGNVITNEHQVLIESINVELSYQASVGYDKQEPYIAYETYYEKEPYLTYESYYDYGTKSTRQRQVTKYKNVAKQRQVTKYKTVTDWSVYSGKHHTDSIVFVENSPHEHLDEALFRHSFTSVPHMKGDEVFVEEGQISVNAFTDKTVTSKHHNNIYSSLISAIPGDHCKDVDFTIDELSIEARTVYLTPEYEASVSYGGKSYTKRVFPFGHDELSGDKIDNELSIEAIKKKLTSTLHEHNQKVERGATKKRWAACAFPMLLATLLIVASFICSIKSTSKSIIIASFIAAAVVFALSIIIEIAATAAINRGTERAIEAETSRVEANIKNYASNHVLMMHEALNKKLKSLGLAPATADDLG